jgi:TonB family protein
VSLVFDARKHAERSKRAREVSDVQQSADLGMPASESRGNPPRTEVSPAQSKNREQLAPQFGVDIRQEPANSPRVARADAAWATTTAANKDANAEHRPLVRSLLGTAQPELRLGAPSALNAELGSTASPGRPVRDAGKIEPPALISRTDPIYPPVAKGSLTSGKVEVQFRISPEGKPYNVKFVQGPLILARAAIEAVEKWCYQPARLYGAPVDSHASTNFDFSLD